MQNKNGRGQVYSIVVCTRKERRTADNRDSKAKTNRLDQNKSSSVICFTMSCKLAIYQENDTNNGQKKANMTQVRLKGTDCIGYHLSKLFEVQFAVTISICFHYRLVHYLLQLLVLKSKVDWLIFTEDCHRQTDLQVVPHHHLQYQEQLAVRYVSVAIHIVNLERNWQRKFKCQQKALEPRTRTYTSTFLLCPLYYWKRSIPQQTLGNPPFLHR